MPGLMARVRRLFGAVAGVMVVLPVAALWPPLSGAAAVPARITPTTGSVAVAPAPELPAGAVALGAVPASAVEQGEVVLKPRDEAALQAFIATVSDKSSPLYHHYLAPGTYGARFGPSEGTIAGVVAELRSDGLSVNGVASDGLLVKFSATATRIDGAFSTSLERYRLPDGSVGIGTTRPIRVPSSIAGDVQAVVGLDDLVHEQAISLSRPRASATAGRGRPGAVSHAFVHALGQANACEDASAAAKKYGGLTDDQIENAYGATPLYSAGDLGGGQTIAVYELEPFKPSDISTFDKCYFPKSYQTVFGNLQSEYTSTGATAADLTIDGGEPPGYGSGEALLDIEDVSAVAPAATVKVYEAPNTTFGAIDEYSAIVNQDAAKVVTTSWGLCETALAESSPGSASTENLLFEQAAAQGQSVFAAAGDAGSDDCYLQGRKPVSPILSVDDPGSQPYVVSVGGTTITDASQPPEEHVWNDGDYYGAGGGGISDTWGMPSWQLASRVPGMDNLKVVKKAETFESSNFCVADSAAAGSLPACREVPDVSAQADEFTGAITVFSALLGPGAAGWSTFGGTSSSAPLWASMLALVNASPTCAEDPTTASGVGFVSPLLYAVASSPSEYSESFTDIVRGDNDPFGDSNLFPATPGYDMASGLGSPQLTHKGGAGLAYNLCSAAVSLIRPAIASVLTLSGDRYAATSSSEGTPVTITGTGFESGGKAVVADVSIGHVALPIGSVTASTIQTTLPPSESLGTPGDGSDGAGAYQVVVTLEDGQSSEPGQGSLFDFVDESSGSTIPAVTSVGSYAGPDSGGTTADVFGTGFTGVTAVEFGGVSAIYRVVSDYEIVATVPPFSSGSTFCAEDGSFYGTGEDAANDLCQVAVTVTNGNGTSGDGSLTSCQSATILPAFEGLYVPNPLGVLRAPPGEEVAPMPCEYDYVPRPSISSVSTSGRPAEYASENGGTVVTIEGSGLNLAALDWVNFGNPGSYATQVFSTVYESGTMIQLVAPPLIGPGQPASVDPVSVPVSVTTAAGRSSHAPVTYAGVPTVTRLSIRGAPDDLPRQFRVTGKGMNDVVSVEFVDHLSSNSFATQYHFSVVSDTALRTSTVPENPALVDVSLCTATGCSKHTQHDRMWIYPPGNPVVSSISPASGPPGGGRRAVIHGQNLGCVTGVRFGKVKAAHFANVKALIDCGSTTEVTVVVPPGKAGTSVLVTVATVETELTGGAGKSHAHYRYRSSG